MNKLFASPAACRDIVLAVVLAAGMWLTRSHDVTILTLPDLTWAAFFLAGALSHRWVLPIGLTLNAFAIDYVALSHGVSDYCVTPAYAFLTMDTQCALGLVGSRGLLCDSALRRRDRRVLHFQRRLLRVRRLLRRRVGGGVRATRATVCPGVLRKHRALWLCRLAGRLRRATCRGFPFAGDIEMNTL